MLAGECADRSLGPDTRTPNASCAHYKGDVALHQPAFLCSVGLGLQTRCLLPPSSVRFHHKGALDGDGKGWSSRVYFLSLGCFIIAQQ